GLGVLAGDTLRAMADLRLPVVAATLVHRRGYFRQHLDGDGKQTESPDEWSPEDRLEALEPRVLVTIEGRPVTLRAWKYEVAGVTDHGRPVYLLASDIESNDEYDRPLTDSPYAGRIPYRLWQAVVHGACGTAIPRYP